MSTVDDMQTRDGEQVIFFDDHDGWWLLHSIATGGTCEHCGKDAFGGMAFEHPRDYDPKDRSGNANSIAYCPKCWITIGP